MNIQQRKTIVNHIKILLVSMVLSFNLFGSYTLAAAQKDPVQFLHSITDKVLTELKHSHNAHKNINEVNRIVDNFIMPNVDFDEMCQWIVGRAIWAKAIESERDNFSNNPRVRPIDEPTSSASTPTDLVAVAYASTLSRPSL